MADKVKYRKLRKAFAFNWRSIPCVVSATITSEPVQLDDGNWYWLDASGVRDGVLESVAILGNGTVQIDFGIARVGENFTYSDGSAIQNDTVPVGGVWTVPNTVKVNTFTTLDGNIFNLENADQPRIWSVTSLNETIDILNVTIGSDVVIDNRFISYSNQYGYRLAGTEIIPPYLVNGKAVSAADGNVLDFKGKVRINSQIVDSNVYQFTGSTNRIDLNSTLNLGKVFKIYGRVKFDDISLNNTITDYDTTSTVRFINNSCTFRINGTSYPIFLSGLPINGVWYEFSIEKNNTSVNIAVGNFTGTTTINDIDNIDWLVSYLFARSIGDIPLNGMVDRVCLDVNDICVLDMKTSEGGGRTAYDSSGNGNHGTITNADLNTFHAKANVRPDNIIDGYDLWQEDAIPTNFVRVPFDVNGNSILTNGDTLTGYTWISHNPAGAWSNNPESNYIWPKCYATINADSKLTTPYLTDGSGNMVAKSHDDLVPNVLNEDIIFADALDDSKKRKVVITDGTCDFYTLLRIQRELDLIDGPLRITETGEIVRITETDEPIYVTKY